MRTYQPSDYETILEWSFVRDMNPPPKWSIPETGIVVPGIAMGFLILTNNRCAILDFYLSNPVSDKRIRDKALDDITSKLIELAEDMHVKMILCNSQHPAVKERARKHGFNSLGLFECFEKGI